MTATESPRPPLRIVLAWIVVALPQGWGVAKSVGNSLPLFRPSATSPPAK